MDRPGLGNVGPLQAVAPQHLKEHWPFVEGGLSLMLRKMGGRWHPLDIYRRIRDGKCSLLILPGKGFTILERDLEPISGEPYLNVWLMWFKPHEMKPYRDQIIQQLDAIKTATQCSWIQFTSPREWGEMIEPDFKRYATIWRRGE